MLTFNTFMTIFGAVGTPVWFGIGEVVGEGYGEENLMRIGFYAAVALGSCAVFIVPFVVNIMVSFEELKKSLLFVFLSTLSCVLPLVALASVNYEFPTLAAGIVGLAVTTCLTLCGIGLGKKPEPVEKEASEAEKGVVELVEDVEKGASQPEIVVSKSKDQLWASCITGEAAPENSVENPLETSKSVKSLRDRAVNNEVQLCTKTVKRFRKGRHLAILPSKIMAVLEGDKTPKANVKLEIDDAHAEHFTGLTLFDCFFRTMPLWLTVLLLILTRIEPIGLKDALRLKEPTIVDGDLGTLGHLSVSCVLKVSLTKILGTDIAWSYDLLYIPFILPFIVAGSACLLVFHKDLEKGPRQIFSALTERIKGPAIALSGALVLVELLRTADSAKEAPAVVIGARLSETLSHGFLALSFPLGALGSFFSGSTTVSCLTFTQATQHNSTLTNAFKRIKLIH